MNKTRKAIYLLPIGLLCAVFIYPFLHELGHGLVVFFAWCKSCGVAMVSTAEYIVQNELNRCYRICSCRNGRDYIPSSTLLVNPLQPQILDLVCSFYC